jgi:protein-L-isoaspartate(D-aspartate) O-methyltransferase
MVSPPSPHRSASSWPVIPEAVSMIADQITSRERIAPQILDVMRRLDRRLFVPAELAGRAWDDCPLPIGAMQTISQPYVVATMTSLLRIEPTARVFELGTGSGYQTAILATLAREVVTVERHEILARRARATLDRLGLRNVTYLVGDGTRLGEDVGGAPGLGEFDRILFAAAAFRPPEHLTRLLRTNGIMIGPVAPEAAHGPLPLEEGWQQLLRWHRDQAARLTRETLFSVRFVPLVEEGGEPHPLPPDST